MLHLPLLFIYFIKGIKPVEKYIFKEMEKYGYINNNKNGINKQGKSNGKALS